MTEPAGGTPATADRPTLRVVHGGEPTSEELAALVAAVALSARTAAPVAVRTSLHGRWADRAAGLRRAVPAGPGAWRASGRVPGTRTRAGW